VAFLVMINAYKVVDIEINTNLYQSLLTQGYFLVVYALSSSKMRCSFNFPSPNNIYFSAFIHDSHFLHLSKSLRVISAFFSRASISVTFKGFQHY
jgi:hypothetical protein